jgi:hypothetical protein
VARLFEELFRGLAVELLVNFETSQREKEAKQQKAAKVRFTFAAFLC